MKWDIIEALLRLGLGLVLLAATNIALGTVNALFATKFSISRFRQGIMKVGIIILCFFATGFVGLLNPDIASIQINGMEVDVLTALHLTVLVGYYHYARQVMSKLSELLSARDTKGNGEKKL